MRILLLVLAFAAMAVRSAAQTTEHKIGFSDTQIEAANMALDYGGAKSRIVSLSLWSETDSAKALSGVHYVRGDLELKCGIPTKKVDVAKVHFVLSGSSEFPKQLADSLRSKGFALLPPDSVVTMMLVNRADNSDLLFQIMVTAFKACNTEPGKADYLALSVWSSVAPRASHSRQGLGTSR